MLAARRCRMRCAHCGQSMIESRRSPHAASTRAARARALARGAPLAGAGRALRGTPVRRARRRQDHVCARRCCARSGVGERCAARRYTLIEPYALAAIACCTSISIASADAAELRLARAARRARAGRQLLLVEWPERAPGDRLAGRISRSSWRCAGAGRSATLEAQARRAWLQPGRFKTSDST